MTFSVPADDRSGKKNEIPKCWCGRNMVKVHGIWLCPDCDIKQMDQQTRGKHGNKR